MKIHPIELVGYAIRVAATTAVYFVAGLFGLSAALIHESASAVWPPTGIALAALLLGGLRYWPAVFAGAFLVNLTTPVSVPVCLGIACGNTLESVVGTVLFRRFAQGGGPFSGPNGYFHFVTLVAGVGTLVSPTIGVCALALGGYAPWEEFGRIWFTWWLGDVVGAIVVAPVLILWLTTPLPRWERTRFLEHSLLFGAVALLSWAVFHGVVRKADETPPAFLCLPIMVLAAFRLGPRETATASVLLSAIAIHGFMTTAHPHGTRTEHEDLLMHQLFLASTAVTAMALSILSADGRRKGAALRGARNDLEMRVEERTVQLSHSNEALRREIVERRQAEDRFRSLLESAPDALVIVDAAGTIVLVNAQAETSFGYPREELLGQSVEMLMPERFRERHRLHFNRFFALPRSGPIGVGLSLIGLRRGGQEFPVEIILSPLITAQGVLVSSAVRDVSARREVEEKLRQSERLAAIGEMIAGMAHESRNALQRSRACLEMLGLEVQDRPRACDLVARLSNAQQHLQHLYEEVREYAAPIVLDRQPTDLGRLIHEVWNNLADTRSGKRIHFREERGDVNLLCHVDRFGIGQVFRNILENAQDACRDSGEIVVEWREVEIGGVASLRIAIRDDGTGLNPEQRERIFEPFYTTKTHGTGLGMAIARRLVEAHDGVLEIGPDRNPGAEIAIVLPRRKP